MKPKKRKMTQVGPSGASKVIRVNRGVQKYQGAYKTDIDRSLENQFKPYRKSPKSLRNPITL